MEQLKNCLPAAISTYINEQKADTLHKAATLADDFILTQKVTFKEKPREKTSVELPVSMPRKSSSYKSAVSTNDRACFYCKVPGHLIANCPVLKKKSNTKPVGLISVDSSLKLDRPTPVSVCHASETGYGPFLHCGTVSIPSLSESARSNSLRYWCQSFTYPGGGIAVV